MGGGLVGAGRQGRKYTRAAGPRVLPPPLPPEQVGMVMVGRPSVDDSRTLGQLAFQAGDYLDVALL